jgi:hypothetical protein
VKPVAYWAAVSAPFGSAQGGLKAVPFQNLDVKQLVACFTAFLYCAARRGNDLQSGAEKMEYGQSALCFLAASGRRRRLRG